MFYFLTNIIQFIEIRESDHHFNRSNMKQMSKKILELQGNKTCRKNHGNRQYITANKEYHISHKQPRSRKRSNDIIIDISNLKRSSFIQYQYYFTKSAKNKKLSKQPQKFQSHCEYGLDFKQARLSDQRKEQKVQNNVHRPFVGKIMKNFHNEKLTQATSQTPKKLSRKRLHSQSYDSDFIPKKQVGQSKEILSSPLLQNKQSKTSIKNQFMRQPSRNYNTLIKSEKKQFDIKASANEYFCEINIKCNKSNKKSSKSSSREKISNHQVNERYRCPHRISDGHRKRSQTVAVNTTDCTKQERTARNSVNDVLLEYHRTEEQLKDPADDLTCLTKSALLEEVIYLRNLTLSLYQQKQAKQRKVKWIPETIPEYEGYEE